MNVQTRLIKYMTKNSNLFNGIFFQITFSYLANESFSHTYSRETKLRAASATHPFMFKSIAFIPYAVVEGMGENDFK